MTQRLNYSQLSPDLTKKLMELSGALTHSAIEEPLRHLVAIRTAQLNGCAFCVDMHSKEAKLAGERELRLYHLPVWRESPMFSARERAALAWAEVLTRLPEHGVPDDIYNHARTELSEKEITDLTFVIAANNAWNRFGAGFLSTPGALDAMFGLDKAGLN